MLLRWLGRRRERRERAERIAECDRIAKLLRRAARQLPEDSPTTLPALLVATSLESQAAHLRAVERGDMVMAGEHATEAAYFLKCARRYAVSADPECAARLVA